MSLPLSPSASSPTPSRCIPAFIPLPASPLLTPKTTTTTTIDHQHYPHILDQIISVAPLQALATLRCTSRYVQSRVERVLYRHVVVAPAAPRSIDVVFLGPDGSRLPGLSSHDTAAMAATAARLEQHTRMMDVVRHPFDTEDFTDNVDPYWWYYKLKLDCVRTPSPRSLWDGYLAYHPDYWGKRYFTQFAAYNRQTDYTVFPPTSTKAVCFIDLVPPFPRGLSKLSNRAPPRKRKPYSSHFGNGLVPTGLPRCGATVTEMVLNIRFEPYHPCFTAIGLGWRRMVRCSPDKRTFIFTAIQPRESDEESIKAARSLPAPPVFDLEQQCADVRKDDEKIPGGIVWMLHGLARPNLTVVGLEQLSDADLSFGPHLANLAWEDRLEIIKERFDVVEQLSQELDLRYILPGEGPLPPAPMPCFKTLEEYRDLVGETTWHLETCEPAGPWSAVEHCSCRE